jgi:hypothetical protein
VPSAVTSGYNPIQFQDFSGGLNLRDKADAVGDREAIDLLNVIFSERGAVRQRDGTKRFTTAELANRPSTMSPFYTTAGLRQLVCGSDNRLDVLGPTGVVVVSKTGLGAGPWSFTRMGTDQGEYLYATNGIDPPQRWDGATWTVPAAKVDVTTGLTMPKAGVFCSTGVAPGLTSTNNAANRMVATCFGTAKTAGPNGFATNPSRVFFSEPGRPEEWQVTNIQPDPTKAALGANWLDLTVGDGEQIMGAVTWRELTFIFKETKFFVVWGEQTDPVDGTPIFNYREVVNQAGLASRNALYAGRDGVYFMNRRGIYVTTGSAPVLLSDILTPLWTQDPDVYYSGFPINLSRLDLVRALWHMERIYFAVPTGVATFNDRVLVYDVPGKWWTVFDCPMAAMASYRPGFEPSVYYSEGTGAHDVDYLDYGTHTDPGNAPIRSFWRSGWGDYGQPVQKTIRETKLWGSGSIQVSFSMDYNKTQRAQMPVQFGNPGLWPVANVGTWNAWLVPLNGLWPGSGQVTSKLVRYARRATVFSTQFTNDSSGEAWSMHRVAAHIRETREASIG